MADGVVQVVCIFAGFFCLVLSVIESGVLTSPAITGELSVSILSIFLVFAYYISELFCYRHIHL